MAVVTSTLTCGENEVYVSVTKTCKLYASEESYKILDGTTVLKTSAPFANNEQRTDEYCLPATTNSQYTLALIDNYNGVGDSWGSGAWISVEGIYGNVVFKNYMTAKREDDFTLSLHYAVLKNQEWKLMATSSSIPADWTAASFVESGWNAVTLGSASAVSGTQYFRKTFAAISGMAAYELKMYYMHGIIAYVNGVEIYRDHMAEGEVTPATVSSGAFTAIEERGVIRPASDLEGTNNVLAVELHFPDAGEHAIDFDAFVASLASSTPVDPTATTKCFIYPYNVTITASAGLTPENIFNFNKADYLQSTNSGLPLAVSYELGSVRAHINGVRVYPYSYTNYAPNAYSLEGAMSSSGPYSTVLSASGLVYSTETHLTTYGYFNAKPYQSYHLTLISMSGIFMYAVEAQLVTCSVALPNTIEFDHDSYSVYTNYGEVSVHPIIEEFTNCQIAPALPAGLTLDPATCSVSGKPTVALASTVFTMTSTVGTKSIQGTFTLESIECAGTLMEILRIYKYNAYYESFSIKDMTTQQVVLSVAYNSGQVNYDRVSTFFCVANAKFEIDLGCSAAYWQASSFLYLNAMILGEEYDVIRRIHYDSNMGLPSSQVVNAQWSVAPQSQWFYKMNEVPANWYGAETSGWSTGSMGSYTGATNQIQLYKKTFNVASLSDVAGFVISLRYLYGCVIYLNGTEVFRNGVEGELSASSVGLNAYTDLLYRQITLPVRTATVGDTPSVNYLQEGANTIAIAIVAQTASQTDSVFDCTVRLMGDVEVSRVFDYTVSYSAISGSPSSIPEHYYSYNMYYSSCNDNYWTMSFKNDRREWISSVTLFLHYQQNKQQPTRVKIMARNTNQEEWTLIRDVTGMTWSLMGEHKKLWLENSKPYNQYRFENFASGNPSECYWKLGAIDLSSSMFPASIPDLAFASPVVIVRNIEMGEVYPNSEYYYDFAITPALPEGISLDFNTGKISGTCALLVPAASYTITAKKVGGGTGSAVITLSVEPCHGDKHFITMVVRTDSWPDEASYRLISGRGTTGEVVSSNDKFAVKDALNYGDFCLPHAVYTLQLFDSAEDGWIVPAGWYLTIDVGEMVIDMGQMPTGVASVSTVFSSLMPFQIEYEEWKYFNKGEAVAANWKDVDFDEAGWETKKVAEFGNHVGTTAYIRHEVSIPSLDDYHVLNVRVKYSGGVVAYFNGRIVARFNLRENFDATTEATAVHDASLFSKFHVILSTAGAVEGKNVMAFEVHRAPGESAVVFDATGIFGVNECSPVADSFSAIDASEVEGFSKEELLDLKPTTYGALPNEVGAFYSWVVENLEGSKFNSFAIQSGNGVSSLSFSIYTRWGETEEHTSILSVTGQVTKGRERFAWALPVAIAGFTNYKFEYDSVSSAVLNIYAFVPQYCKATGAGSCPAVGDYPSVGEGEISPAKCADGFRGYAYRTCANGQLGEVQTDKCEYKLPDNLNYLKSTMEFVMNTEVASEPPAYDNIITEFYMQESTPLPVGLSLNPTTGVISGVPAEVTEANSYVVRGKNPKGETFTTVIISVRKGYCAPEGLFERTLVGDVAVYQCSMQGSYVGSQKRACVLGKKDGEWQKASGFCMPIFGMIAIILGAIIIVAVVIFILTRSRKTKAVGGVKGKGGKASKASGAKKSAAKSTKAVKV